MERRRRAPSGGDLADGLTNLNELRCARLGMALAGLVLLEVVGIAAYTMNREPDAVVSSATREFPASILGGNTQELGWVLYTDYLIPFELASMLLLVAMVGAIVLARRTM